MLTTFVMCHVFQLNVFFKTCQPPLLIMGRLFFFFFSYSNLVWKGKAWNNVAEYIHTFQKLCSNDKLLHAKISLPPILFLCFLFSSLSFFLPLTIFLHLSISGGYVEGCKDVRGFVRFIYIKYRSRELKRY